jgi:hypothetical protein
MLPPVVEPYQYAMRKPLDLAGSAVPFPNWLSFEHKENEDVKVSQT